MRSLFKLSALALLLILPLGANAANSASPTFQAPADIAFTADLDGTTQRYVLLLPMDFKRDERYDLMIALHGHGSDRWQFATAERDECRGARDAAAARGMIFVSPDYRAKTSWMGPAAEADLLQIIARLKEQFTLGKLILCGGSMGGSSALTFAAMHPELIDGVVALNGTANHLEYENFQEAIAESFGGSKREIPEEYHRRSAEYWPQRLTMPVAMTTGGRDTAVPPQSVMRLAEILNKLNPNVLHIHRPEGEHATNYEDTAAAMTFVLDRLHLPEQRPAPPKSR